MEQEVVAVSQENTEFKELDAYFNNNGIRSVFLVCDAAFQQFRICSYFEKLEEKTGIKVVEFSAFEPNPRYESVVAGVKLFQNSSCDCIVAVGGGSAIDVAKCIKLYRNANGDGCDGSFLNQEVVARPMNFLAVPTTAGTGSEATRYAVVYYNGEKLSLTQESMIPDTVLMDASVLKTLPIYQKKSTMLDALCHAVESFWSINSTNESIAYSKQAIKQILANLEGYLRNQNDAGGQMMSAAYIAGKAIHITQTTAGHAMCYKLTGLYGISHGHAAALCVKELWPWMIGHVDQCVDARGRAYLEHVFLQLAEAFGGRHAKDGCRKFSELLQWLGMETPKAAEGDDMELARSVNTVRLKNNPVLLDNGSLRYLYHKMLYPQAK